MAESHAGGTTGGTRRIQPYLSAMIARALKLKLNAAQRADVERLLFQCAGVWNWAVKKVGQDARGGIFYKKNTLNRLLKGHGARCGVNQQTLEQLAEDVRRSYEEHWRAGKGRPRLKGRRNRLASIPLRQGLRLPDSTHVQLPGLGRVKFRHSGPIREGAIKAGRLERRARGWYVTLFIDAPPAAIALVGEQEVGIDLGYETLATLAFADGTSAKIPHPREYQRLERGLAQAQRGGSNVKAARLQQRSANARRHRNHEISRALVARCRAIHFSRDNLRGLQRLFGKSVLSAAHGQLITMTQAKGRQAGRVVTEPRSRNSTRRCSSCGGLHGPTGLAGLRVRQWRCACGAQHDRDVNAAVNALTAGAVLALRE
jgi:putative transposase